MRIFGFNISIVETLIALNVIVFFVSMFSYSYFLTQFGLIPTLVKEQPWRLVTSMFLHGGYSHILFNMFSLYFFGMYLGSIVGEKELLKIYLLGGLAGGVLFVLLSSPLSVAIGASWAIFALGGALAVLRPKMVVYVFPIPLPMPLWFDVFVLMAVMSFMPGIAWQGHIGGLVVGAIFGYLYKKKEPYHGNLYGAYAR